MSDDLTQIIVEGLTIPPDHTLVIIVPAGTDTDTLQHMRSILDDAHPGGTLVLGGGVTATHVSHDEAIAIDTAST